MLRHKKENDSMNIVYIGEEVLSRKAMKVDDIASVDTQTLIDKMFSTMHTEKGIGLAAPQVNISQRIVVIALDDEKYTLINPQITHSSEDTVIFTEACLSVPGKELPIIRNKKVTVHYIDRNGKQCILKAEGLLAIVCQHEIDHLEGILITDRFEQQSVLRQSLNITQEV